MADLDDIEDMIGEEELSRAAMDASARAAIVAPKHAPSGAAAAADVPSDTSVPGTQLIWYVHVLAH